MNKYSRYPCIHSWLLVRSSQWFAGNLIYNLYSYSTKTILRYRELLDFVIKRASATCVRKLACVHLKINTAVGCICVGVRFLLETHIMPQEYKEEVLFFIFFLEMNKKYSFFSFVWKMAWISFACTLISCFRYFSVDMGSKLHNKNETNNWRHGGKNIMKKQKLNFKKLKWNVFCCNVLLLL